MLKQTQLVVICKPLEWSLRAAGFVFSDIHFDEAAQALRIIVNKLNKRPSHESASMVQADSAARETIDARLLWDVLRDLNNLGVVNPAIQFREEEDRDQGRARGFPGGEDPPLFSGRNSNGSY
jgi:hypothetical protein